MRPLPYQKRWWLKDLSEKQTEVCRLTCRAYARRAHTDDPAHQEHKAVRRAYMAMIEIAKRCHWEGFLKAVDERMVWTAHWYVSGKQQMGGRHGYPCSRCSSMVRQHVRWCRTRTRAKCYRKRSSWASSGRTATTMKWNNPPPKFDFTPITNQKIHHSITRLGQHKAPGMDGI